MHGNLTILKYVNANNIIVEFTNTGYKTKTTARNIKNGIVKDKLNPVIVGVGFIGDGDKSFSSDPIAYKKWNSMLRRCYDKETQDRQPTYKGCSVCIEWHNFQNFALWYNERHIDGCELDKDIKNSNNKIYSPDNCMLVQSKENRVKALARNYTFKSPEGHIVSVYNLSDFCLENKLNRTCMTMVNIGRHKYHKGWSAT